MHRFPEAMLGDRWHRVLIGLTILFSLHSLHGGIRLLRRRREWILARQAQERAEAGAD